MMFKEGDTVSQTKLKSMMTGLTTPRWTKHENPKEGEPKASFVDTAITTLFKGGSAKVIDARSMKHYELYAAETETQKLRWMYDSKRKKYFKFAVMNLADLDMEARRARNAEKKKLNSKEE